MSRKFQIIVYLVLATLLFCSIEITLSSINTYREYWVRPIEFLSSISIIHLLNIFCCSLLLIWITWIHDKVSNLFIVVVIAISVFFLNISAYRPFDGAWNYRIAANLSPVTNPFFYRATELKDIKTCLIEYKNSISKGYRSRLDTYPPGIQIFYFLFQKIPKKIPIHFLPPYNNVILNDFLKNPALSALQTQDSISAAKFFSFLGIISVSIIPVLVFFNLNLITGKSSACYGAIISSFIPSFHLFADMPDIYFAPLSLIITLFVSLFLKTNQIRYLILTGLLISIMLCFALSFSAIAFFCFLLIILHVKDREKKFILQSIVFFLLSIFIPMILFMTFDYNAIKTLILIHSNNQEFYSNSGRTRITAFGMNILELFLFTGALWPILFFRSVPVLFLEYIHQIFSTSEMSLEMKFLISSKLTIIVLLLSGGVRSEIARNGIIVMPLICMSLPLYYKFNKNEFIGLSIFAFLSFVITCFLMEVSFAFIVF